MIHYIFVTKIVIAKNFVEILIREIIQLHNFSSFITTNRNSIFTFKYHDLLCYAFKIKLKLFTTYHFQINNQTKRQNNIMKQYFKTFVNFKQNDSIELLFMTKFIYNNNKHAFIRLSLFEIMQNYISTISFEKFANFKVKSKFVKKHVEKFAKFLKIFKINLIHAQEQQIKYKNAKTKNVKDIFKVDNYVNVNDKNIRIKRNKKFE